MKYLKIISLAIFALAIVGGAVLMALFQQHDAGIAMASFGAIGLIPGNMPHIGREQYEQVKAYIQQHLNGTRSLKVQNYPIYHERLRVLTKIVDRRSSYNFDFRQSTNKTPTPLDILLPANDVFFGFYTRFALCRVPDINDSSTYLTAHIQTAPTYTAANIPQNAFNFSNDFLSIYNTGFLEWTSGGRQHWMRKPVMNYFFDQNDNPHTFLNGFNLEHPTGVLNGRSDQKITITYDTPTATLAGTDPVGHYMVLEFSGYRVQGIAPDLENADLVI